MESIVQFAVGLGLGGIYALIALGLVLVYRGSGVVNFANTGLALLSAVVFYETYGVGGWPVGAGHHCGGRCIHRDWLRHAVRDHEAAEERVLPDAHRSHAGGAFHN